MLAAISTTILSRRSCAETGSAMVSRSRLNRTRGPPDALRISSNPLPPGQPTGRPGVGVKLKTQQIYSFGVWYRPNHTAKTVAQFTIGLIFRPYTELSLVLPSKRPASVTDQKSVHSGWRGCANL